MVTTNPKGKRIEPGNLPPRGARMLDEVYESTLTRKNPSTGRRYTKARAAEIAWGTVKRYYYRRGGKWRRRKRPLREGERAPEYNPTTDFASDWNTLKRAPLRLDSVDVAELGDVLELEVAGLVLKWRRGQPFLWDPRQKAIIILQGAKRGRALRVDSADARAADAFRRFMGRVAKRERVDRMGKMSRGVWRKAPGYADRYDYWSDKFDAKIREYTHPITSNVSVYRGGGPRPPWVWVIRGGSLNVTTRGIVG